MPMPRPPTPRPLLVLLLCCCVLAYKEFALARTAINDERYSCTASPSGSTRAYSELCYFKDVNYHMQLFIDGVLYYVAVDLTAPLSWLKAPACRGDAGSCSIIENSEKTAAAEEYRYVLVKARLFGKQHNNPHPQDVVLAGSTDLVAGELQNVEFAEFYAKDSKSAQEFMRLVGLSLFLTPERDLITIRNTSIIKAEKLSQGVNRLTDGAIAFRPSQQRSSLLSQLFANSESAQRVATIFLHPLSKRGTISIGDLSLKNSRSRQSEIVWVAMREGASQISCSSTGISLEDAFDSGSRGIASNLAKDIVLTTSSSFIFLPEEYIQWLTASLKEKTSASCRIRKDSGVLRCDWQSMEGKRQALLLTLSFRLMQYARISIPMTTLTVISDGLFIEFAVQSSPSGKIILGEPFFEQYVAFVDYGSSRVGFAPAIFHQADKFTTVLVYFLRLLLFGAIVLFFAYVCFNPCQQFKKFLSRKARKVKRSLQMKRYESLDELGEAQLAN